MITTQVESEIIQNLKDAGCGESEIEIFMRHYQCGDIKKGLKMLSLHRQRLLDGLHIGQRRVDCLDYLVHELNRAETER